jgi:cation transport protein ChaC
VTALTFVANRDHEQYAGKLTPEQMAALILQARGLRGTCRDYLANTVRHLDELGLADGLLHRVLALVQAAGTEEEA